ncbi:MAG TPA: hypothetical protein VFM68_02165 [Candidatus Saccharimonadales bacterium]|nr:hypothetical protein [Candidatus Saccharimonadales bacterium]
MEITSANNEAVTMSDILELATWNRPRSTEELQNFIRTHHDQLPDDTEIE